MQSLFLSGGLDYSPLSGLLLTFPSGSGPNDALSFNVSITDDSLLEFNEFFTVRATSMDSAVTFTPGRDTSTVIILDDDSKFVKDLYLIYVTLPSKKFNFTYLTFLFDQGVL